jgi:hypothetical protein
METEKTAIAFNWRQAIDETYQDLSRQFIEYAPELIGAFALMIFGWLVAYLLRISTKKIVHGLDSIFQKGSKHDDEHRENIKRSYSIILSQIVFWAVILFFIAASANLLGWKMFTGWMDGIVSFLPSLITGLLIILAGYLLGNAARATILSTDIQQATVLARIAQIVILFSAGVIGIELIGLNMHFLTNVVVVIIGILLAGAALAFGLGAKTMVANIVGTQYARKQCRIGEQMRVGDVEGKVLEITQTNIILDTENGRAIVPGKLFHEQVSHLNSRDGPSETVNGEERGTP